MIHRCLPFRLGQAHFRSWHPASLIRHHSPCTQHLPHSSIVHSHYKQPNYYSLLNVSVSHHTHTTTNRAQKRAFTSVAVAVRHQSFLELKASELARLAFITGQPLTGTKRVLAKRISSCLDNIMDDIDHLQKDSLDTTAPSPVVVANLKQYLLPRSIISIDVGIRNLAWVELSSRGEILRWDIENLVPETDAATHEGGEDTLDESIIPSPPPPSLSPSPSPSPDTPTTTTSTTKSQKKTKKPTKKKPMASSFDPRTVALRLDEIMQKIMGSQDISAIIIERQRFRTGGMHAVLDVTFKCGVVEGMIHTWLTFWDNQRVIRGASSKTKRIIIESIAPRSVGSWWGIGVGSTSAAYTKPSPPETLRDSVDDAEDIKKMTDIRDSGDRNAAAVTKETRAESHVYATKKKQARTIVDNWIRSAVSESDTFTQWQGSGDHSMRVSCSPTIRDWYMQEKKRDDLSDCLLQAVAWYEWRGYAIDEAISRKIAAIKLVKSVS